MRQIAIAEATAEGVTIPAAMLRTLGVARGDRVAFVICDGSIVLAKVADSSPVSGRIRDIVGVFAAGMPRTPADDAAFLHEVRYGDEPDDE